MPIGLPVFLGCLSVDLSACLLVNLSSYLSCLSACLLVPVGSPSRRGDVAVYLFDINQPSLPTAFHSVLVSISVFMALSTVFHSINYHNNSLFSDSVLLVLSLPRWSFQLYIPL